MTSVKAEQCETTRAEQCETTEVMKDNLKAVNHPANSGCSQ